MASIDILKKSINSLLMCELYEYQNSHSMLYIKIRCDDELFYASFQDTLYFSGFRYWETTHFQIQPEQACIELLEQAGYGKGTMRASQMVSLIAYKLISGVNTNPRIQILCRSMNIFTEVEALNYKILR